MARTNLADYLQVYPFWLMDVAPVEPLALPIFTPLLGFSAITSPEMTLDIMEVTEGNWYFRNKVVKQADAANITLMRASKWFDADFYRWTLAAMSGNTGGRGGMNAMSIGGATPRRTLLLVHFLSRSPLPEGFSQAAGALGLLTLQGTVTGMVGGGINALGSRTTLDTAVAVAGGAVASGAGASLGPVEFAPRIPAKAWVLYGCVPTRYKTGGDFDATSSEVSIQELEIAVEHWDELNLGSEVAPIAMAVSTALGA